VIAEVASIPLGEATQGRLYHRRMVVVVLPLAQVLNILTYGGSSTCGSSLTGITRIFLSLR
jgi:hypothetical protein